MAWGEGGYTGLLHLQTAPSPTHMEEVVGHCCSNTCPGVLGKLRGSGDSGPGHFQSCYSGKAETEARESGGLSEGWARAEHTWQSSSALPPTSGAGVQLSVWPDTWERCLGPCRTTAKPRRNQNHQDSGLLPMPAQTFSPKRRWQTSGCWATGLQRVLLKLAALICGFQGCWGCPCTDMVSLAVPLPAKSLPRCVPIGYCPQVCGQRAIATEDQRQLAFGGGREKRRGQIISSAANPNINTSESCNKNLLPWKRKKKMLFLREIMKQSMWSFVEKNMPKPVTVSLLLEKSNFSSISL